MRRKYFRKSYLMYTIPGLFFFMAAIFVFLFFLVWFQNFDRNFARLLLSDTALPVTLTVFGRGSDSTDNGQNAISARINFYTPDGTVSGTVERSWPGWELKIECILVGSRNGYLVFPFRANTDETKQGRGVDLLKYYGGSAIPAIYDSRLLTGSERRSLAYLFFLVRTEGWIPGITGNLRHETVSIRSFVPGTEYSLFVSANGSLSLRAN